MVRIFIVYNRFKKFEDKLINQVNHSSVDGPSSDLPLTKDLRKKKMTALMVQTFEMESKIAKAKDDVCILSKYRKINKKDQIVT